MDYKVTGTRPETLDIDIERIHERDIIPILPYIYFPTGVTTLRSTRMVLLDKESASNFEINRLPVRTMDVYHNLLNIVGYRMRRYAGASLAVTGTSNQSPEEWGTSTVGLDRAEAVKRYLVSTWGIDPSRIQVTGRGLPERPTATSIPAGQEENARVELYSDNVVLLDPVEVINTQAVVGASQVKILPTVVSDEGVKSWSISIKQGDRLIGLYEGHGMPPSTLLWAPDLRLLSAREQQVVMDLSVTDNRDRTSSTIAKIPVAIRVREREEASTVGNIRRDRLHLILFDFNSAELKASHTRYIRDIVNRIDKRSSVIISGYTDYIGSPQYNMKLSYERSRAVFDVLKRYVSPRQVVLNPHGSRNAPYSNALPEGRAYNRTVIITVETPMEK
ncbi:MAG: OmpA family protein [Chlorobi bacterium]|nr:OmpA family protein [Chlorobiota bacterium]